MNELIILKYILDISSYNKYRKYLRIKDNRELEQILDILDSMIDQYERSITLTELESTCLSINSSLQSWFDQIKTLDIGEDVLESLIKKHVEKVWSYDHALLSVDVSEGRKPLDDLINHYSSLESKTVVEETKFVTDNLEDLYNETVATPGLRWRLGVLNKSLGSLRKGDFGFIFARPETGKTTFLASEITNFARQSTGPILWINNEEQGNKVKIRCYQAALGINNVQLFSDRNGAYKKYMEETGGRIQILDSATTHKRTVERIVKEMNPSAVVIDQIDKIKGFDNDREDLRLGSIYIWARELAKSYCPVIGVCQADVSGEGKKWLTMDNVANAKTSKQAEADFILGIGCTHEVGTESFRYLHLSKNKLSGDPDSDPTMRHARMEVLIEPQIARYRELGNGS